MNHFEPFKLDQIPPFLIVLYRSTPLTPFSRTAMTHKWISGPDPLHHRMYVQFGYHRTSARLRNEYWDLPWEVWRDLWLPHWQSRGRTWDSLCLARIDMDGPWTLDNVHLITRRAHSRLIRKHHL